MHHALRPSARTVAVPLLLLLALCGCGADDKFDVKLNNVELRNLRGRDLGIDLKFSRTVRAIGKADGVALTVKAHPADGGEPATLTAAAVEGMLLADTLVVSGAPTHDPAAYYKVEVRLERAGKEFAGGLFLVERGIGSPVDRKAFDAAVPPPPPPAAPDGETGEDAPEGGDGEEPQ